MINREEAYSPTALQEPMSPPEDRPASLFRYIFSMPHNTPGEQEIHFDVAHEIQVHEIPLSEREKISTLCLSFQMTSSGSDAKISRRSIYIDTFFIARKFKTAAGGILVTIKPYLKKFSSCTGLYVIMLVVWG
ncbi:hypothetical protein ACFLZL_00035 [Thermodesulfobacteriota bacterium]